MSKAANISVAGYLTKRLTEIGLSDYFAIPGDYNLILLDELLKEDSLRAIYCCNELNTGYAADGYARARGFAAAFVTYSVGGLSIINAAAGAYAEDLPIVFVSGSPNTNSEPDQHLLHHTLGKLDYDYVRKMFSEVTVDAVTIKQHDEAGQQIDLALARALYFRKPVYIEIPCNVASLDITAPTCKLVPIEIATSQNTLNAAVDHAVEVSNQAVKPTLIAGTKLRAFNAQSAFEELITASRYAVANQPHAKSFVDETDEQYIGTYWGSVSSPGCGEIIESSDLNIFVGTLFNDYSTVGYSALIKEDNAIIVNPTSVKIKGSIYNQVNMADFLSAFAQKVKANSTALDAYHRIQGEAPPVAKPDNDADIPTRYLFNKIEGMLDGKTSIITETGDSWFNAMRLKLPQGCQVESQMQYGSIGWSVGATLGFQAAVENQRRVITLVGDGSFQMTAQEVSTMMRYGLKPIIFLMNNKGYTIEVEIHDGPYNQINNWCYTGLIEAFNHRQYECLIQEVRTVGELDSAIEQAEKFDGLCFIEVHLHKDDCNKNLLKWGSYVATANGQKPRIF